MRHSRIVHCAGILLCLLPVKDVLSQATQQPQENTPTFRITSNLVYLDVTVLDKKGRPVVTGLTRDDFTILDNKAPQRIFSFEPPQVHMSAANPDDDRAEAKAPVTIYVLDLLNSGPMSFTYIVDEMIRYLKEQPDTLPSPTEIMVLGNKSLDMIQSATRDKAELLDALKHMPNALPMKLNGAFTAERSFPSTDALGEIAMQNQGIPGRKNVIWLGPGGPGINYRIFGFQFGPKILGDLEAYQRFTSNLLVNARITLYVILPGVRAPSPMPAHAASAFIDPALAESGDPFATDMNFGNFALETGGQYFYNRNFADLLIKQALTLATNYYTLTYQPRDVEPDGEFRHIEVVMRNPNLHAVTKDGYYAPEPDNTPPARNRSMMSIVAAVRATVPITNMQVAVSDLERHTDASAVSFTVQLKARDLDWTPQPDGSSADHLILAAASLSGTGDIKVSRLLRIDLTSSISDPRNGPDVVVTYPFTLRYPRKSRRIRLVVEQDEGGRMGAVDLTGAQIAAAPEAPTVNPELQPVRSSAQR